MSDGGWDSAGDEDDEALMVAQAVEASKAAIAVAAVRRAAREGDASTLQRLLSTNDAAMVISAPDVMGWSTLMHAAYFGHATAMRALLDHPSVDARALLMHADDHGVTALLAAVKDGYVDAVDLLLNHPRADPAAPLRRATDNGTTALMVASNGGCVDVMRILLGHPSVDCPAAMMEHTDECGVTALILAASQGYVDAMRLLLDHPSADPAALLAFRGGVSALVAAALFAGGSAEDDDDAEAAASRLAPSFAPLLFLLRRVAVQPQPLDEAHMSAVVEVLMNGGRWGALLDDDQPDDARDECARLLAEFGARAPPARA